MKISHALTFPVIAGAILLAGCSSEHRSTSAVPPPAAVTTTTESTSTTATTTDTTVATPDTSSQTVTPPTDTSSGTIPLKDLPTKKGYPYAIKTKWPGLVKSPYAQDKTLVDVSSLAPGSPARCPHTGKIFIVP